MLKNLNELHELARGHTRKKMVLAAADDKHALEAAFNAYKNEIVDVILVGNEEEIYEISSKTDINMSVFELIDEKDNTKAAEIAVKLVSEGRADILMKGNLNTSVLLKAVLNKEWGLRSGELISHLALFEVPAYHKIIGLTDAAMNIAPDLKEKISIIKNAVDYLIRLGITEPKVALLSAVENVNPNIKSSVDAALIAKMYDRNQIKNGMIDGPFAFDNAVSKKSAKLKNIKSEVAGDADLLVGNDIDSSNALYKSFIYFAQAKCAAVILGAKAPIVLTSRADSDETKLNSIALAAAIR